MSTRPFGIWFSLPNARGESDCACAMEIAHSRPHARVESDCACALATSTAPPFLPPAAQYTLPPSLFRAPVSATHEVVFNPEGIGAVAVLDRETARVLDTFAHPRPLDGPVAEHLARLGLLTPFPPHPQGVFRSTSLLTIWLHLTARCNLACTYCFAPNRRDIMTPEVGERAISRAVASALRHGFAGLKVKYAGGEPTLNFQVVQHLHDHARRVTGEHHLLLREVLLTNGMLLSREMMMWLRDEEIRLSISLDGIGNAHDRQRPRVGGGGTFAQVVSRIDEAVALGLQPHISVTVTRYNVDHLAEIARFALERGLTFNLNFVRPSPEQFHLMPEATKLIESIRAVLDIIKEHSPPFRLIDGLLDRVDLAQPHARPCGAGHSYLAVGPHGAMSSCHMLLDPGKGGPEEQENDLLRLVSSQSVSLRNPTFTEKETCRTCRWRAVCAGGCPLLARWAGGNENRPSPYCHVYLTLLPDLILTEGRRILKRHGMV